MADAWIRRQTRSYSAARVLEGDPRLLAVVADVNAG
jgi:hypothetical protein